MLCEVLTSFYSSLNSLLLMLLAGWMERRSVWENVSLNVGKSQSWTELTLRSYQSFQFSCTDIINTNFWAVTFLSTQKAKVSTRVRDQIRVLHGGIFISQSASSLIGQRNNIVVFLNKDKIYFFLPYICQKLNYYWSSHKT